MEHNLTLISELNAKIAELERQNSALTFKVDVLRYQKNIARQNIEDARRDIQAFLRLTPQPQAKTDDHSQAETDDHLKRVYAIVEAVATGNLKEAIILLLHEKPRGIRDLAHELLDAGATISIAQVEAEMQTIQQAGLAIEAPPGGVPGQ